jgi:hypothetical protein
MPGSFPPTWDASAKAVRDTATADAVPMLEIKKLRRVAFIGTLSVYCRKN